MSPVSIGIAAESAGDARIVQTLVDHMLIEEIEWVAETFEACRESMQDGLASCRSWSGIEGAGWLDLHGASRLARKRRLHIYGSFLGAPGEHDARMHRAALLLFAEEDAPPKAVVIARDMDGDSERATGFEQAVAAGDWPFVVVGALAEPEIEAWLIAAWIPESELEIQTLAGLRRELGFDPCAKPNQLTSKNETDRKDAKRVLAILTTSGRNAKTRWEGVPVAHLESNGKECGLGDFICDVRAHLVPVVSCG